MTAAKLMRLLSAMAIATIAVGAHAVPAVELIAPRGGSVLLGGREATLTWSATSLPPHAEEWEAFLSFDGGRYYATRITPHLDAGRRSFRWRVPNVAAWDVRILLRVGDEREERAIAFPQTFRIIPDVASVKVSEIEAMPTDATGESALPSSPPVVEWVSGDRRGAGLVVRRHRDASTLHPTAIAGGAIGEVLVHSSSPSSLHPPPTTARIINTSTTPLAPAGVEPRPLLLLLTRLNV